ncbi:sensor histidine kinase [Cellulomonas cellasea]|uniref:histidine kinase n=1 Tax=Cellulomonas cellasea TaxID=43670 RepID=A0A7W4UJM1_9CELL|nr:ATP-binding protein [Cellulomonas cellasea]MBB2925371.1 signal transduction histidine kinase [Cellulomonas cellasea]
MTSTTGLRGPRGTGRGRLPRGSGSSRTATTPATPASADRRSLVLATSAVLSVFAVGAAVQTAYVLGDATGEGALWARITANFLAVAVMAVGLAGLRVHRQRRRPRVLAGVAAAALVAGSARVAAQVALGVHSSAWDGVLVTELASGTACAVVAGLVGAAFTESQRRLRDEVHEAARARMQIEVALQALQHEEVRVRRAVAEGLHGSLQQRLVLAVARLDRVLDHLEHDRVTEADTELLRVLRADLEDVRVGDVREMSRMLYPEQLEVGMVPAVRTLLGRLPSSIATRLTVPDDVRRLDDPAAPVLTRAERLLAVRVVEEAVTNALRHGGAASLEVGVTLAGDRLAVSVVDDGAGFAADDPAADRRSPESGLARLRERLEIVGGSLDVGSAPGRGTRVEAHVPVRALGS